MACDLCGAFDQNKVLYRMPDLRFTRYEINYTVVECLECGHRFLSPQPTIESSEFLYHSDYYASRGLTNPKQKKRYLKQAEYLPPAAKGKILDVGCAGGSWLKIAKSMDWECYGADYIRSDYAEPDIDIRFGYLPEIDFPSSFFDVITAWGVMEHIHEPSKYFKYINSRLKDGGAFIMMVPNGDSLWSRWAFKEDIPRHLHFFRAKTLRSYAEKYGFRIQKIEYTNSIYSNPATGRGLFRKRLLRMAGVPWEDLQSPPGILKLLGKAGSVLDYSLIHPKIEEYFGLCGNMVVILEKN